MHQKVGTISSDIGISMFAVRGFRSCCACTTLCLPCLLPRSPPLCPIYLTFWTPGLSHRPHSCIPLSRCIALPLTVHPTASVVKRLSTSLNLVSLCWILRYGVSVYVSLFQGEPLLYMIPLADDVISKLGGRGKIFVCKGWQVMKRDIKRCTYASR